MSMIDDVIEYAHAEGLDLAVVQDHHRCDAYQLLGSGTVTIWVRPDGRFSRAVSADGELLTLGQVARMICRCEGPARPGHLFCVDDKTAHASLRGRFCRTEVRTRAK